MLLISTAFEKHCRWPQFKSSREIAHMHVGLSGPRQRWKGKLATAQINPLVSPTDKRAE
jgi:hypothetical protein